MKKIFLSVLLICIMVPLVTCSNKTDLSKSLDKEGIAPYILSDEEKNILKLLNIQDTSHIISFNAPKKALTLNVSVYCLKENETWSNIGGGSVSIGTEKIPVDQLRGIFTIQLKENYIIDFAINTNGSISFKTNEIFYNNKENISFYQFLHEFKNITVNTEIPVALMVYDNGTKMRNYCLQDYFEPSKFKGMDLVQVVTLEFSDKVIK